MASRLTLATQEIVYPRISKRHVRLHPEQSSELKLFISIELWAAGDTKLNHLAKDFLSLVKDYSRNLTSTNPYV